MSVRPVTPVPSATYNQLKTSIIQEFASWQGTRYQWGGGNRIGIDYSAFSRRVMA